jgi:hypothetical protein
MALQEIPKLKADNAGYIVGGWEFRGRRIGFLTWPKENTALTRGNEFMQGETIMCCWRAAIRGVSTLI